MRIVRLLCVVVALILIPFVLWDRPLSALSESLLSASRHPVEAGAAVVLLLAADILLPVPSSVVSLAAGAVLGFWPGFLAIWSGMMAASLFGYGVGRWSRGFAIRKLVDAADLERMQRWFDRRGVAVLFWSRPVPVLAETAIVCAGISGVPVVRYAVASVIVNLMVAVAYAAVGVRGLQALW